MRINNNLSALTAYNALTTTTNNLTKTIQQLSTGLRINSAADDAAGFAISEKMRSQLSGLDTALRNSQDGISLLQTAEGALGETNSMLQRMRELAVQASNDSLTSQDRQYIQLEIDELKDQIDRIASTTQFNKKKILDGSSGALWSSSDAGLKARINGGLTYIDEFGQKVSSEGNYRVEVTAEPGQAQVQKSSILSVSEAQKVYEAEGGYTYEININEGQDINGATSGTGWNFSDGVLTISGSGKYSIIGTGTTTSNRVVVEPGIDAQVRLTDVDIAAYEGSAFEITGSNVVMYLKGENSLIAGSPERAGLEVQSIRDGTSGSLVINSTEGFGSEEGTLTATGSGCGAGIGGPCYSQPLNRKGSVGNITINGGTIIATASFAGAGIGGGGYYSGTDYSANVNITINGGNITASALGSGAGIGSGGVAPKDHSNVDKITINGGKIKASAAEGNGGAAIGGGDGANSGNITIRSGVELELSGWIDTENGHTLPIGRGRDGLYDKVEFAGYTDSRITLEDIPAFYNASGVFTVRQPQKITITQGNGKTTTITLYAKDTIEDVRKKFNDAIAFGLGQSSCTDNTSDFVSFVASGKEDISGLESVADTLVIRSAIPGKSGELYFSGDDELIRALGLNTIQESTETTYTASVYDTHSGEHIVSGVKASGTEFKSLIPPEIDIEVDAMAGLKSSWDENTKRFMTARSEVYTAMLHLKNNGLTFQIGGNMGEDFSIQLGDSSSSALNLTEVNVATRETASRSIGILDRAINKIASQRAKIGAYENALEHTMENLTTSSANLTSAESRIRDADISAAMMDFVKYQILNQSGTSMLSQANQLPQSVLSLLQ